MYNAVMVLLKIHNDVKSILWIQIRYVTTYDRLSKEKKSRKQIFPGVPPQYHSYIFITKLIIIDFIVSVRPCSHHP